MFTDPYGLVGQVLDGQFRVDRHIGEGGFSVVYRGTHVGLSEPIAIKCLKLPAVLGSALVESFVRRFRDESRLHYKLSQGNLHIVRSVGSGTTLAPATGALVPYTVLEWLEGHSLADEFAQRHAAGQRGRSLREVVQLLDSAIDALAFAHAQGVIHRDLNPGNFFLAKTPSGVKVKILDFGVAKVMADSALAMGPTQQTVGNMRMFAPAYGAPEQFDERLGAIGPWTDVYTVALVVLEALRDHTVMDGEHLGDFVGKALDEEKRPTPRALGIAVGDATERLFGRALAVDPSKRPRDAGEFWGMLKNAMQVDARSGRAPHADPTAAADDGPSTLRVNPSMMAGTVRMDRPRSASDLLAATPLPSQVAPPASQFTPRPSPAPAAMPQSSPSGFNSTLHMPGRPSQTPGTPLPPQPSGAAPLALQSTLLHPSAVTPVPAPVFSPQFSPGAAPPQGGPLGPVPVAGPVIVHSRRSPVLAFVLVALALLVVAGASVGAFYLYTAYRAHALP
ncbi:MAG TPA: protein kinase [Polyangiaceae bacterium]|jgi:serine/threonine-protein kinase|nr:protein kinase [Polyangiaceae bacterium]